MDIISDPAAMQAWALAEKRQGRRIGFVPTMGALHDGHLSLVKVAREASERVVVSIFVNPIQFGPSEDLARYPRDFDRDRRLCEAAGVDGVFFPSVDAMYAPDRSVSIDESTLSSGLCGARRPGHFQGVLTVVAKLFNIVQPDLAVFGQKDAQQARLIEQMVRDLDFPVRIVVAPILREADGLAMSSRNAYLTVEERRKAPVIHQALREAESLQRQGAVDTEPICARVLAMLQSCEGMQVEYVEAVDWRTLAPVRQVRGPTLVAVAVRLGRTRLIDNVLLNAECRMGNGERGP